MYLYIVSNNKEKKVSLLSGVWEGPGMCMSLLGLRTLLQLWVVLILYSTQETKSTPAVSVTW